MASFVRWPVVIASVALLGACRDDYEVKVIAAGAPAPAGWSTTTYRQLDADGKCIEGGGMVAFRRPAHTVSEAIRSCYEDDAGRAIAVPIRLPERAWTRAGWHACTPAHTAAFEAACTAWAPHRTP